MRNLVLALVVGLVTSCATIVSDSDYYVTINSDQETEIEVKNRKGGIIYMGTTPAVVRLASGSGYFSREIYTIRATRKGYSPTQQIIHADLDGWYFGNISFGRVSRGFTYRSPYRSYVEDTSTTDIRKVEGYRRNKRYLMVSMTRKK